MAANNANNPHNPHSSCSRTLGVSTRPSPQVTTNSRLDRPRHSPTSPRSKPPLGDSWSGLRVTDTPCVHLPPSVNVY